MSTKGTLKHERDDETRQGFHLYNEVFDDENVYLALEGFPFEAVSSVELSNTGGPRVVVRLPNAWAKKLGLV